MSQLDQIKYWQSKDQENQYLEEVTGEKSLNWVKQKNSQTLSHFGDPKSSAIYQQTLSILESKDKIPHVRKIGEKVYNFWKDDQHLRGIWRRTSLESYRTASPAWETVLDLDELGKQENQSWVYGGHDVFDLDPHVPPTRALIYLSPGGSDATVIREFDLETCQFVEDGFVIPEAKSNVCWKSIDTLLVGTDFKDNNSLTTSGYPRVVHEWTRGTPLLSSPRVFEGDEKDISAYQQFYSHCGYTYEYRVRSLTFYTSLYSMKSNETGEWQELNLPEDISIQFFRNIMLLTTRSDWMLPNSSRTYPAGALVAVGIDEFLKHGTDAEMTLLFEPSTSVSLDSCTLLQSYVILSVLDDIKSRLIFWEYSASSNGWVSHGQESEASIRGVSVSAFDSDLSNMFWFTTSSFLTPSRLYLLNAEDGVNNIQSSVSSSPPLKSLPAYFDSSSLVESQYFATSSDGTRVPYFILHSRDIEYNSQNKTLLYGYGGFEVSILPTYSAVTGATWLTTPGNRTTHNTVYVIANIRGGGEYGPKWHQSALKENRCNAYNDFIAVAEDLIRRKITSSSYLAIRGEAMEVSSWEI
jgi:prolyl oligopeptidase